MVTAKIPVNVLESLNAGLHAVMSDNTNVLLIGEDLLDPYGGAFKVTRGLSTAFPGRVLTSPISEAGITGLAGGMALRGLRPVVEIMFGDFLVLAADQIINHLAKFRYMYADQVTCPVVIRTPMGGRRGYGPTHSQTLEKHFLGVPGIWVFAPFHAPGEDALGAPGRLLYDLIMSTQDPVLFIENKLQYLLPLSLPSSWQISNKSDGLGAPFYKVSIKGAPRPALTMTAYGYMAYLAMQAQQQLAYDYEIFTELLVPTQLAPFELAPLFDSIKMTGKLLALEEGSGALGWGAEVLALSATELGARLLSAERICAANHAVPASRSLEEAALPGVNDIVTIVKRMV